MKNVYNSIAGWIVGHAPKIIVALLILVTGQWLIRLARGWIRAILEKRHVDVSLRPFLQSFLAVLLQIVLFLVCMQVLDIRMTLLAAVVGALSVAAGLALSGTMQNFASGILILLLKPYRVGDNIIAQSMEGSVTSIQLFYTVITTYTNTTVIIPNSKLSNEVIINVSRLGHRRLDIQLKFAYNIDFDLVKKTLYESLDSAPEVEKEPSPRIGIQSLEADGFIVLINVWLPAHGFTDARLDLQEKLLRDMKNSEVKM